MNTFDNGQHLGESQRQPGPPGMRYPVGQPNGSSSPQDGYGRPIQPMRSPANGHYGGPMHGSQYAGPRRPNPAQHMPNQPGPRQMPYRGPPQGPPRGASHGPPGPQRSQRPAPGISFNNFQGPQQHPRGPSPTRNDSEPYQHHGQPPTQVIRGARGATVPAPPNNALKAAPGSMQQSSTPLYVSPVRTDLQGQPQQSPPSLSKNHLAESQPSPVGFISEWPLAKNHNGYASTDTTSSSVKPDEGSHSRSHGSYASSAVVPEVWNKELVPALAESTAATQKSDSASLSAPSGKTPNIQAHGNETANPPSASPGETLKASAKANSPETGSNSKPDSKLVPESTANSVSQTAVPNSTDTRASVSSLSDLILRATKLATFIDKNQRPVSKMAPLAEFNNAGEKSIEVHEKKSHDRQSSDFSDMLAAFPPVNPQHHPPNPSRASWLQRMSGHFRPDIQLPSNASADLPPPKKGRRCCGMPVWAFIILMVLLVCAVAAAIIIPLELFVLKGFGNNKPSALTEGKGDCRESLVCMNGGTSVLSQGTCACICTGGFTGAHCDEAVSAGCATTNLIGPDGSVEVGNVTVGVAIPRLVADANANFSIALSGTSILAKFSNTNLSCIAQNSLVTFDGQSGRSENKVKARASTATKLSDLPFSGTRSHSLRHKRRTPAAEKNHIHSVISDRDIPSKPQLIAARATSTSRQSTTTDAPFNATDHVLDFARVAVLFILQEQNLDSATKAQSTLQSLFQKAANAQSKHGTLVSEKEVKNITVGGQNTVDLVNLAIHLG